MGLTLITVLANFMNLFWVIHFKSFQPNLMFFLKYDFLMGFITCFNVT